MDAETSTTDRDVPRVDDPAAFLRDLEASGRFHRDTGAGRIFHPGAISYREKVAENSLHIVIEGGRLSAHIDRYSPVRFTADGAARYSFWRIAVHNVTGAIKDLVRVLSGRPRAAAEEGDTTSQAIVIDGFMEGRLEGEAAREALGRLRTEFLARTDQSVEQVSFNLIDEIVHLLDTPEEPWTVQMELRVAGRLDQSRLRAAFDEALRRHPLARAGRSFPRQARNRNFWETPDRLDSDPLRVTACADDAALVAARSQFYSTPVSLESSPPLRAELVRASGGDLVMVNLHHAATDGIGALRLVHSVARAYTGADDPLPELDLLAVRDLMGGHAAGDAKERVIRYLALAERLREVLSPPARIARDGGHDEPGYRIHHERLSAEETRRVAELDLQGGGTDVLVAALHLAIADWNARHRVPCRRVTVLLPANLRPPDHAHEMVGNFSLPARISTTARDRSSAAATLVAVAAQTSRKHDSGMGTSLLELLSWSWLVPLSVKKTAIRALDQRFTDTAMLSDLGRVEEPPSFGDEAGETVEVWYSPPARMPLGVAIGAATVGDALHLAFRSRNPQFGPQAAQRFAACYVEQLRRVAAHGPRT